MRVLVTGGAGYIGSHTVHMLAEAGNEVIVYDNLSNGRLASLPSSVVFVEGDVTDHMSLQDCMKTHRPEAVIHFAALIEVEESISSPLKYYRNNFYGTLCLLEACDKNKINNLIFSSTAAVYGDGSSDPLSEDHLTIPINPYGQSKLISEQLIKDFSKANPWFRHVVLRYFNVAGAQTDPRTLKASLKIGQFRERATHLITLAARAAVGTVNGLKIFGTDYDTEDGTCIRDYIHINDLAQAHLKALDYLISEKRSDVFNCGYGKGFSVEQVVKSMKKVSGVDFKVERVGRRPGDPASLVANSTKGRKLLSWQPLFNDIDIICRSAFDWETHREEKLRAESKN